MILTLEKLNACMPFAGARAAIFVECLNTAMLERDIDKPERQAAFLAQIAHESASLKYTLEIADGSAYENRADLGNTQPGDGPRFKGRGLIQITGRFNYEKLSLALGRDVVKDVQYLETPMGASRSAAWFWQVNGLNDLADQGKFGSITKRINGGFNGLDDRIFHFVRIRKVFGI